MPVCYLGIGSNLGDKRKNLKSALKKINNLKSTKILKVSRFFNTKPEGGPKGQPDFLNGVIKIRTSLSPFELLKNLKKIEESLGRKKTVRNGPREIDLDILLYSDRIIKNKRLTIPHPRMFKRKFVKKPLWEVL